MLDCDHLIHPFQNNPGTSQGDRVMNDLLSGSAKLDARSLADLLDYFIQLSRHINFYDYELNVSDWQPFFKKSLPFALTSLIKYNSEVKNEKFDLYTALFNKYPSKPGLQLLFHYFYYSTIYQFNYWHLLLKGSGLPAESLTEKLIKDRLNTPLKTFIHLLNTASKWIGIKRIDFFKLTENKVWDLDITDLYSVDTCLTTKIKGKKKQLQYLQKELEKLFPSFNESTSILSIGAESSLELSLFPLKEEFQKNHSPHLGLLFAFIKLFQHLQSDLNGFTKKHLDFFYKEVLQIKPKEAQPDSAHLIFEIQKHLKKYLLKKGLLSKDGKDNNKAEVFFELEDEIVVNKTQITEIKTLFLNNEDIYEHNYLEGVYCAPKANASDGIEKEFKDNDPKNYPTLGNKFSKYKKEGRKEFEPYPLARLGFILASPVLLLQEGTRTIDITLACELNDAICDDKFPAVSVSNAYCGPTNEPSAEKPKYLDFIPSDELLSQVQETLESTFYYVSEDLIEEATKKGIKADDAQSIKEIFLKDTCKKPVCSPDQKFYKTSSIVEAGDWKSKFYNAKTAGEKEILDKIFTERRALKVLFSGEKAWVEPSEYKKPVITKTSATQFKISFSFILNPDIPAITFYNAENLKEDFSTTEPLVKIELEDLIKITLNDELKDKFGIGSTSNCCLHKEEDTCDRSISLYHFFRNVMVTGQTNIKVKVCGLKNFIVQNDENVQNVNSLIYPFGSRPDVIGFDLINPVKAGVEKNLVGPNFYIGSQEVFGKEWDDVYINIDWKDKPKDFNEHYKAYWVDPDDDTKYGLNEEDFQINLSLLEDGAWKKETLHQLPPPPTTFLNPVTQDNNRELFKSSAGADFCFPANQNEKQTIYLKKNHITGLVSKYRLTNGIIQKLTVDSRDFFLRINLQNQDFLHKNYAFVLARQMMALGQYPDKGLEGAVYLKEGNSVIVFKDTGAIIILIKSLIDSAATKAGLTKAEADQVVADLLSVLDPTSDGGINITPNEVNNILNPITNSTSTLAGETQTLLDTIVSEIENLQKLLSIFNNDGTLKENFSVLIPNEPWTPIIKNIDLDYTASATIEDIELIHLYPFAGTHKKEEIRLKPSLFPTHCDEGSLFLGLKDLVPATNLNILFQLAEATADSEAGKEEIFWHFLNNNEWRILRNGFEILEDATNGLTGTGIVKLALPENMTNDNTILPKGLHWIKASIPKNSRTVSEVIGIHTQAVRTSFTIGPDNDKLRLAQALPADSISKLKEADAAVKKVSQPYESFGGRIPEAEGHYYVRVSELLKHKGRAILKFDYERLVLEAFPALYKAKCINHTYALDAHVYKNDFPIAPGYILLAVIPDLNKLKAGNTFEPKAPVSLLEQIETFFKKINAPFVRLSATNPRYEKVNFCLKIKLIFGKDENYYKEKLQQDLREFLAPWAIGEYSKLTFGQPVTKSDVVGFLETTDYVDYVIELLMGHEAEVPKDQYEVIPHTPRSILIAGEIEVCVCQNDCEEWYREGKCENTPELIVDYCDEIIR